MHAHPNHPQFHMVFFISDDKLNELLPQYSFSSFIEEIQMYYITYSIFQADLRKVQTLAGDLRKDAQIKKTIADRKQKYVD